jgi:hypothetical protein
MFAEARAAADGDSNVRIGRSRSGPRTIQASEVEARAVEWRWSGFVPAGLLTGLFGPTTAGKSSLTYDLAARLSREGLCSIIVNAEDPAAQVIRPRLEAAGADLHLVRLWSADLVLPDAVASLREEVEREDVALVVIDPLNAFIGMQINSHRDHHVRRVLAPLSDLAEETGTAVVVVGHVNKGNGTDPVLRIGGSIGLTAAARHVVLAAPDPNDDGRRILAAPLSNIAAPPTPLAYRIAPATVGEVGTSRIEWLGEAPEVDASSLLASPDPEERALHHEVAGAIVRALSDGPRPAKEVERELREEFGSLSHGVVVKARHRVGVKAEKEDFRGGWMWRLPEESREESRLTPSDRDSSSLPAETRAMQAEESRPLDGDSSEERLPEDDAIHLLMDELDARQEFEWGATSEGRVRAVLAARPSLGDLDAGNAAKVGDLALIRRVRREVNGAS